MRTGTATARLTTWNVACFAVFTMVFQSLFLVAESMTPISESADEGSIRFDSQGGETDILAIENANRYPTRLALGPRGRLFVSDAKVGSVFIYDASLDMVGELKGLSSPLGVGVDARGRIFVGNDGRDNVEMYGVCGSLIGQTEEGIVEMPNDMALDRRGGLYVVDSIKGMVLVFEPGSPSKASPTAEETRPLTLSLSGIIGSPGDGTGEFRFPTAITIAYPQDGGGSKGGELHVADQGHCLIQVFDLYGQFLRTYGAQVVQNGGSWDWHGKFVRLQSLAVDPWGRIHAVDCYLNKIQMLDSKSGVFVSAYGEFGSTPGKLNLPLDIVINNSAQVLVANAGNGCVEILPQLAMPIEIEGNAHD